MQQNLCRKGSADDSSPTLSEQGPDQATSPPPSKVLAIGPIGNDAESGTQETLAKARMRAMEGITDSGLT